MKPQCKLIGENGNVFNLIGIVAKTLKKAGNPAQAQEFTEKAVQQPSYEAVLQLIHEYVEVT